MLSCPRCAEAMPRRKTISGWSWVCPACGGSTATVAMLRKAVARDAVQELWVRARGGEGRPGVRCPSCTRAMREVPVRSMAGVEDVDVCTACHFVWFDAHELRRMPVPVPTDDRYAPARRPRSAEAAAAAARFELEHMRAMREEGMTGGSPAEGWKWVPGLLGLPVEWEAHPLRALPWATWGLAAAVAVVSLLAFGNLDAVVSEHGFLPSAPLRHGGLTFLTSFFLHVGWWHLVGNLWFLLVFGDNVEDTLGRGRYLGLLAAATVVGDLVHMGLTTTPGIVCVGASGGISGVLGYYALRFPRAKVGLLFYWVAWIRMGAVWWFLLWVGMQVFGAWIATGGVAYGAHLGGALVGVGVWAFERLGDRRAAVGAGRARGERGAERWRR